MNLSIKTVTVVGANGTMGTNVSAIFASFGNATVYMVARDKEKSKKAAIRARKSVKADSIVNHLFPVDYSNLVCAYGARMFVDLYKQVTGQAGKY